jgi:DNA modification methylase
VTWAITAGDARVVLAGWPAGAVQCVVTSPPYYLLRDYGIAGQIGLERSLDEYIANLVEVFRAVRRVLRPDGTLWLNIGDSYSNAGRAGSRGAKRGAGKPGWTDGGALGDKQLLLVPARVALALQTDGWILRSAIVWSKPNTMPESVTDRPTKSYEMVYLFSQQARYYYDAAAIAEPAVRGSCGSTFTEGKTGVNGQGRVSLLPREEHETRNARDVFTIPTESFEGAHFAVMPTELARRCILAGTSAAGQCAACGAPWARVTERETGERNTFRGSNGQQVHRPGADHTLRALPSVTTGWAPTCRCDAGAPVPQVVADPFTGAGTVGVVALRHGRGFWGAELNESYCRMARARIVGDSPLFNRQAEGVA